MDHWVCPAWDLDSTLRNMRDKFLLNKLNFLHIQCGCLTIYLTIFLQFVRLYPIKRTSEMLEEQNNIISDDHKYQLNLIWQCQLAIQCHTSHHKSTFNNKEM